MDRDRLVEEEGRRADEPEQAEALLRARPSARGFSVFVRGAGLEKRMPSARARGHILRQSNAAVTMVKDRAGGVRPGPWA